MVKEGSSFKASFLPDQISIEVFVNEAIHRMPSDYRPLVTAPDCACAVPRHLHLGSDQ